MTCNSRPCGRAAWTCQGASFWWGTTWAASACRCCSSRPPLLPPGARWRNRVRRKLDVRHRNPEVLVVGAGPVGLVAAVFLQQYGVRVEIVDMHQRTTQHSYALAIHPRTLRILDQAELSEGLIGAGRELTKVAYYEGRQRRAEIDYSALASKHPYLLVVRQSLLERAAEEALRRQKLKVLWGHRLQSLTVDGAAAPGGGREARPGGDWLPRRANRVARARSETIQPAYVIGADGYNSAVRRMAGIEMAEHGRGQVFSICNRSDGRSSRRGARHSQSGPDERLLAPRGGAMPLGIPDSARFRTRGIDGAARAANRREGSLVDGAADANLLVDARAIRGTPRAEPRHWKASGSPGTPRTSRLRLACTA